MSRIALVLLLLAGVAHADTSLIARDPPPPPPPQPAPAVYSVPPEPDRLRDRLTFLPAMGGIDMTIDGVSGGGMLVQPTVTRTFDRLELQGELGLSSWDGHGPMATRSVFARLGATARYQAARLRLDNEMTLDLVVETGAGMENIARDREPMIERPDLEVGAAFRIIAAPLGGERRTLIGMEASIRMLVAPHDHGFAVLFGLPIGR